LEVLPQVELLKTDVKERSQTCFRVSPELLEVKGYEKDVYQHCLKVIAESVQLEEI